MAIPLPGALRPAADEVRRLLAASDRDWRFVHGEGLHVTIRFLGEVDPDRHAALDAAWREAASGVGPVALRLRGAAVLPPSSRPRILCLRVVEETPAGLLARLALRLELAAREQGFAPEHRPFSPHVTLARARRGTRIPRPSVATVGDLGAFVAHRVVLYSSETDRGGARYRELADYPLVATPA